jgi:hypothetical protein
MVSAPSLFTSLTLSHLLIKAMGQSTPHASIAITQEKEPELPEGTQLSIDVAIVLIDSGQVAEYGDISASYWNLYLDEANINDNNMTDSLIDDTDSMALVVSLGTPGIRTATSDHRLTEHYILLHHRIFYHRDV